MQLHDYESSSGKDLIMEYLDSLTVTEKADGLSVMRCMENNEFDKIIFKRWNRKVYEVYFRKNNRIFYVAADSDNLYLLHACRKQKNKTENKDRQIVIKRAKELGNLLDKKFI